MPAKLVRSVPLAPELAALVDVTMASAYHPSASKMGRAALRQLAQKDHRDWPRPFQDKAAHHAQPRS